MDRQVCLNARRVAEYCAKYASKPESRSVPMREAFKLVVDSVNDDDNIKKVVQKLLTMSVADHDFSAQEACHLLTGERLVTCSRSFIVTSLDGEREVDQDTARQDEGDVATHPSLLDMYMNRPRTRHFEVTCFMDFAASYRITRKCGIKKRETPVVVRIIPQITPNSQSETTSRRYCMQQLVKYKPFRSVDDSTSSFDGDSIRAFGEFVTKPENSILKTRISLSKNINRFLADCTEIRVTEVTSEKEISTENRHATEEWMLLCRVTGDNIQCHN